MVGWLQGIGRQARRIGILLAFSTIPFAFTDVADAQYGGRVPGGSWPQVCRSGYMDGPWLFRATCLNKDGEWRNGSYNMRNCPSWTIYAEGAYLHCGNKPSTGGANWGGYGGGYGGYRGGDHTGAYGGYELPPGPWRYECRNAVIQYGYLLRATCLNNKQKWRDASLDLRQCPRGGYVYADGAYLRC